MKPCSFTYHRPASVEEALSMLAEFADDDGRILAGGQSLMPMMALRLARPLHLIDINEIASLKLLETDKDKIKISALVRHAQFHDVVVANPLGELLKTVASNIAHYPIRHRGTFCGSVAHADPASEWCMLVVVLGATMEVQSYAGSRLIEAQSFFKGVMETALEANEMLTAVYLPQLDRNECYGFYEFNRRPGDFAFAMCLVTFEIENGVISKVRLGIGAAEETPRRLTDVESFLNENTLTKEKIIEAGNIAAGSITPLTDEQISASYRRNILKTVVIRAIEQASKSQNQE
jgi:carbon-monoxide dehydrogenase medium subunit